MTGGIIGNSIIEANRLDETMNSQKMNKEEFSELNEDEYLLNS